MAQASGPFQSLQNFRIENQRVLIRLDLNVPLGEKDSNGVRSVEDNYRILATLPTIQYCIEKRAKVILCSHLGRVTGSGAKRIDPDQSLEPVAYALAELLKTDVTLGPALYDLSEVDGVEMMAKNLKGGQILLLENLRYHPGEEANQPEFANFLARLADFYVNDAFGACHRKHASVFGTPRAIEKNKAPGFLLEKEIQFLNALLEKPAKPFAALLGGAKVSDKIRTIQSLLKQIDVLLVGGAMAHAFTAAKGEKVPENAKQPSKEDIQAAKEIFVSAQKQDVEVFLPLDTKNSFDIGPKTIELFQKELEKCKTVFWNGPVGWFEKEEYAHGTKTLAQFLSEHDSVRIVGGGDTVSAIRHLGLEDRFDHLSTGGGAVLKYLESHSLPGIDALKLHAGSEKKVGTQVAEWGEDENE